MPPTRALLSFMWLNFLSVKSPTSSRRSNGLSSCIRPCLRWVGKGSSSHQWLALRRNRLGGRAGALASGRRAAHGLAGLDDFAQGLDNRLQVGWYATVDFTRFSSHISNSSYRTFVTVGFWPIAAVPRQQPTCMFTTLIGQNTTGTNTQKGILIKRSTFHIVNQPRRPQLGCAQRHQAARRIASLGRS